MESRKKLAVFDLDGTLFDTAEVNYLSYQAAAEECGYKIDREIFYRVFVGKNYKEFLPVFDITDVEIQEEIHEKKKRKYAEFLHTARKNEHLFSMIRCMRPEYVIVLATTASRKNTGDILSCFDAEKEFDFILTQEDVTYLKPNPECYLSAMEKSGIGPEHTIIFEDSEGGIQAAEKSGASVLRVVRFGS